MGRLEVSYNGNWGSVSAASTQAACLRGCYVSYANVHIFLPLLLQICASSFSHEAAEVACRQLGLPLPAIEIPGAVFGESSGRIMLGGVWCTGSEARLDECPHSEWSVTGGCGKDDVSLACNASGECHMEAA